MSSASFAIFSLLIQKFIRSKVSKSAVKEAGELVNNSSPWVSKTVSALPKNLQHVLGSLFATKKTFKKVAAAAKHIQK